MSFSLTKPRQVGIGTNQALKYEVFDSMGATDWNLLSGTWKLLDKTNNELVSTALSGALIMNNADEDASGATIKTMSATVDFSDISEGQYWLFMDVTVSGGYTEHFRALIQAKQLDES